MGTETESPPIIKYRLSMDCVKLNNPLMGTETAVAIGNNTSVSVAEVKLNNPLMGTETLEARVKAVKTSPLS